MNKKIKLITIISMLVLASFAFIRVIAGDQPDYDPSGARPTQTLAASKDVQLVTTGERDENLYGARQPIATQPPLDPSNPGIASSQAHSSDPYGARPAEGSRHAPSQQTEPEAQTSPGQGARNSSPTAPGATNERLPLPGLPTSASNCQLQEGFDTILPSGWISRNMSSPPGVLNWFQGSGSVFMAHSGASNSYAAANFNNTTGVGTISNWLISPHLSFMNGDKVVFYTRTIAGSIQPDRLQVRLSTAGASTNVGADQNSVGDFTTLLADINPTLSVGGYPEVWTEYRLVISGLTTPATGRIAFRYFVTNGGPSASNSNYIGVDTFSLCRTPPPPACSLIQGFDTVLPSEWISRNMSSPPGVLSWYQGNSDVFPAHSGASTSYAAANYSNTSGAGTISSWLISPVLTITNADRVIFYTRTATGSLYPDRLQVRLSIAGASTNVGADQNSVGDFTTLLAEINPALLVGGYPEIWAEYRLVISGLTTPATGRIAFRYFVTNGGPSGSNSNYIGVDTFAVCHYGAYLPLVRK